MAAVERSRVRGHVLAQAPRFDLIGYGAALAIVAWWTWRAFHYPYPLDTGLAYQGGQVAWATGHPEHLATWISTPFLGMVMALVSRIMSETAAADGVTTCNVLLVLCTGAYVLRAVRGSLPRWIWWALVLALASFGPIMSSVWWKQFNIMALALAIAGFELIRRSQQGRGGALIGLSIAIKPLAIILPVVLLARRETRRAGALCILWVVGLNVVGQAFMAVRAGSLSALNIFPVLQNFADKAKPSNYWACLPENFAPGSLLCRLVGSGDWNFQHLIVWGAVALLGVWVVDALRGRAATSWETFSFTCALSVMISPIAWSHYQIMLAPLFVLLVYRFSREGAGVGVWAGLAISYVLASLLWQPFGTVIGGVRSVFVSTPMSEQSLFSTEAVAEFAQYALVLTGVIWYIGSPQRLAALKQRQARRISTP
jgi:glycosyl transferase family 87